MRKNSAIHLIGRIRSKVYSFLEVQLKEHGVEDLVISQGAILAILYKNNGLMNMKDIARLVKRDKSTVTYLVDKLIKKGYVEKNKCSNDQRVCYVTLTQKAKDFQRDFEDISQKLVEKFYANLEEEESVLLEKLLEKVDKGW